MPETTGRCIHQDFWGDPQSRCPKDALDGLLGKCLDHASVAGLMGLAVREMGENRQLRAMVRDLAWALDRFIRYYDQSGIGACTEEDEGNPPAGFDGDEVFNVRHGRETLAKVPPDLRAPAKAAEDGRKEEIPHA